MTGFKMRKRWIVEVLETYRDTPPDAPKRKYIDRLIDISRRAAGGEQEKQYHNLVVLRYITDTHPAVHRICAALHIGRDKANYETVTGNAIDRLLVLAFGVDGIDWDGSSSSRAARSPAHIRAGNKISGDFRGENSRKREYPGRKSPDLFRLI